MPEHDDDNCSLYRAPPPALARELEEVAAAAQAFGEAIRVANELPAEFPKYSTLLIAAALVDLPKGTGEGAYEPLIYARNRLTALRRGFILTEAATREAPGGGEGPPPLTRGLAIDLTLTRLLADVSTALDAHRAWAARDEDSRADVAGTVRIDPTDRGVAAASYKAERTQAALKAGAKELREIVEPGSELGDALARQTQDAAGVAGLGRAELGTRTIAPRWLRRLGAVLGDYPKLMRKTAGAMKVGVDIARPLEKRWTTFQNTVTEAALDGVEGLAGDIIALADKFEGERAEARPPPAAARTHDGFTYGKARAMILRGEAPPAEWVRMIDYLDLSGEGGFDDLSALAGLTALTSLNLSRTQVSDVGALAGLTALTSLNLSRTQVSDVGALAGLTALTSLDLAGTQVSDVGALAGLTALTSLDLAGTQVSDVGALAGLTALTSLDLAGTQVSDVGALAGLTALTSLYLSYTQVSDVGALAGLTALTSLDLSGTQVSDVGALAGLTALTSLYLADTPVSDVSALAGLTALTSLYLSRTEVSDVGALAGLTALTSLYLSYTQVSDVGALAGLTALTSLYLSYTQVSDVGALAGLTTLTSLDLSRTQVSDVGALAGLTALTSLDLSRTRVSDVGALKSLAHLKAIFVDAGQRRDALAATLGERGEIVKNQR